MAPPLTPVVTVGGQVIYAFQPRQLEAYRLTPLFRGPTAEAEHIGFGGAAGGGKSYWARGVGVAVAVSWPGSTGIIFRRTQPEVIKNHVNKLFAEVPRSVVLEKGQKPVELYTWNGTQLCATWWNGSRTYFDFLRYEEDVHRTQGAEFDYIAFEESTHYSWSQISWIVHNRMRASVPGSRPFAVYPSNPGSRGHAWYKRLFIERRFQEDEQPGQYAFVQSFLADNPMLAERDPGYGARLDKMAEPWRSWMRDGNWSAGAGMALSELERKVHLVKPFRVPAYWTRFGAFDWGYQHPWSFGEYAVTEDGDVFKLQTIHGRHHLPAEIAERITSKLDPTKLRYISAGRDCFAEMRARGENTPTIAEQLGKHGLTLSEANVARINGLNNLRAYLSWRNTGPDGTVGDPGLRFFDEPGNRACFEQLETMVTDPDDVEDVLKVDADEFGDAY